MRLAAVSDGAQIVWAEIDEAKRTVALLDVGPQVTWQRLREGTGFAGTKRAERGLDEVALAVPVHGTSKIVAIGLNYVDHAVESEVSMPAEPLVFAKLPSSLIGHGDPIRWGSDITSAVDSEAELAVVMGRTCRNVPEREALEHVFAYTCLNDVSARDLQFGDGQWTRGKSLDTFCPVGPWLVTADEIPDPHSLRIRCTVSGQTLQDATTADMHFSVPELISYLSRMFTLEPGDVIATGTPPGVGYFRDPQRLLRHGDVVTVSIDSIGELTNPVRVDDATGG